MLCPKCRREIPDDSNICCYCGRVIHRLEPRPRKRPNGSGSVYKLTDKRRTRPWVVAKAGKILGRYATKTAALEALEKLTGVAAPLQLRELKDKPVRFSRTVPKEQAAAFVRELVQAGEG